VRVSLQNGDGSYAPSQQIAAYTPAGWNVVGK